MLRIDFDATQRAHESLNFEDEIHLVASAEETNFTEKLLRLEPELLTREVFRETQREPVATQVEVLDAVYHSRSKKKKQFFFYLFGPNSVGKNQIRIFSLSVSLHEGHNGAFCSFEHIKKLRTIEGVSHLQPFKFFKSAEEAGVDVFWWHQILPLAEEVENAKISALKGLVPDSTVPGSDAAKAAHFKYLQRKTIRQIFKLSMGVDSLFVVINNEYCAMIFEDVVIGNFRLPQLTNSGCFDSQFEVVGQIEVRNRVVSMKVRTPARQQLTEIFFCLPVFREEVSLLIIEILKENFSRHLFWGVIKDVWSMLSAGVERAEEIGSELELLAAYFGCLLTRKAIRDWLDEGPAKDTQKIAQSPLINPKRETPAEPNLNAYGDPSFFLLFKNQVTKYQLRQNSKKEETRQPADNTLVGRVRPLKLEERNPMLLNQTVAIQTATRALWQSKIKDFIYKIHIMPVDFEDAKVRLFKMLHLANEDTRLSRDNGSLHARLTFFLYMYATFLDVPYAEAYQNYYTQLSPEVTLRLQRSEFLLRLQTLRSDQPAADSQLPTLPHSGFSDYLEPRPFDLINFINLIFQSRINQAELAETLSKNPYFFRNYYRLINIILFLYDKEFEFDPFRSEADLGHGTAGLSLNELSGIRSVFFLRCYQRLSDASVFQSKLNQKMYKELQLANNKKRNFDRIFMFFLEQKISFLYIESLADFLVYFYKSILRLLRKEISKFLIDGNLSKSAYKLLMREDLYANKFLQPVQSFNTVRTLNLSQPAVSAQGIRLFKPSEVSLQANVPHTFMDATSNQLSTMLLHFNEDRQGQAETGAQAAGRATLGGTTPLNLCRPEGPIFGGQPSTQSIDKIPVPKSNASAEPQESQTELVARLERELNIVGHNYSLNLHFSKTEPPLTDVYRLFNCGETMIVNKANYAKLQNYEEFDEEQLTLGLNAAIHNQVCQRLSSFVGRGAVDYGTETISVTDYISIPPINVTGRIKEKERNFNYTFNTENYTDRSAMNWAEFHNGVAAALSISRRSLSKIDKEGLRTWIEYQKTDFSRHDHAGLVFGLGLQGILDCFTIADIYFNLKGGIDARIIGTILGLAIFKNDNFHYMIEETKQKAFCLLLEVNMSEKSNVHTSRIVQAASMIGNGIYNKGSCKKSLLETMLREIEARPVNDNNSNRECHSLAAGFALGLINLGKGSNVSASKDLQLDECLFKFIMDASQGSVFDKNREAQIPSSRPAHGHHHHPLYKEGYQASNVREPCEGNAILTTPSALVALALIHLKTNNAIVARRLELPNTIYEIINGNPLHVFMKTLARHLIMWQDIETTADFVINSIPPTIRNLQEQPFAELAHFNINNRNFENLDFHNLTVVYYNIIAGTLMAMAIRNAGTGDESVKALIFEYIRRVQSLSILTNEFAVTFAHKNKIDAYSYFNLLAVLSLAVGILMAGRCDSESKILIHGLLKRLRGYENEPNAVPLNGIYGFFMAFQMAIGFLFLGNGALSFGTSDFQVACLLMSVYPVFPSDFNDNKYHLQALRHFYVLAAEDK
jgi:hypothetical protein